MTRAGQTNFLKHGKNILKMIIKGVAIDTAIVNDVAHGDLFKRLFGGQVDKGLGNGPFGR